MRICPQCGMKLPEQANFCLACGCKLSGKNRKNDPEQDQRQSPSVSSDRLLPVEKLPATSEPATPAAGNEPAKTADVQDRPGNEPTKFKKTAAPSETGAVLVAVAEPSESQTTAASPTSEPVEEAEEREFGPTTRARKRAAIVTAVAVITVFALILSSIILSLLGRRKEKKPYILTKSGRALQVINVLTGKSMLLESYVADTAAPDWFYQETADKGGLFYGVGSDTDHYRLNRVSYGHFFSGDSKAEVIEEHVGGRFFVAADGSVFYRTVEGLLCRYKDGVKEELAEAVTNFLLSEDKAYIAFKTKDGSFGVRPSVSNRDLYPLALKKGGENLLWVANAGDVFYTADANTIWRHRKGMEPEALIQNYTLFQPVTAGGSFYYTVNNEVTIPLLETVTDRYKDEDEKLEPLSLAAGEPLTETTAGTGEVDQKKDRNRRLTAGTAETMATTKGESRQLPNSAEHERALKQQLQQADRYLQKLERDKKRRYLARETVRLKKSELWFFDGEESRLIDSYLGRIVAISPDAGSIIYDIIGNLGAGQSDLSELDDVGSYRDRLQKDNERGYKLAVDGVTSTLLPAGPLESPSFSKDNRELTYIYGDGRSLMNTYLENKVVFDTLTLAKEVSSVEDKTATGRQLYYKINNDGTQDLYENGERLLENVSRATATQTDILAISAPGPAQRLLRLTPSGDLYTLSDQVQDSTITSGYATAFVQATDDGYELCYSPSGHRVKQLASYKEPVELIEPLVLSQKTETTFDLSFSDN